MNWEAELTTAHPPPPARFAVGKEGTQEFILNCCTFDLTAAHKMPHSHRHTLGGCALSSQHSQLLLY